MISQMMNRIAKRIRLIKACPMGVHVTLKTVKGAYFNVDLTESSYRFEMCYKGKIEHFLEGNYIQDSGKHVELTSFYNTLPLSDFADLLHAIDTTLRLHEECYGLVINNQHLMDIEMRNRWFH